MRMKSLSKKEWSLCSTIIKFIAKITSADSTQLIVVIIINRSPPNTKTNQILLTNSSKLHNKVDGITTITKISPCSPSPNVLLSSWKTSPKRRKIKKSTLPLSTFLSYLAAGLWKSTKKKLIMLVRHAKNLLKKSKWDFSNVLSVKRWFRLF